MTDIVLLQGHPDPDTSRFCRALAAAYVEGARAAGHNISVIDVTALDFTILRSRKEWEQAAPPAIAAAQQLIGSAQHVVFVFPLWLGTLPALLKAFVEQVFRPAFAFDVSKGPFAGKLKGRSSRIVVTMGMPAWLYRLWFGAHGLKSFEQAILRFVGIKPNRITLIGSVESISPERRDAWLDEMRTLGRLGR